MGSRIFHQCFRIYKFFPFSITRPQRFWIEIKQYLLLLYFFRISHLYSCSNKIFCFSVLLQTKSQSRGKDSENVERAETKGRTKIVVWRLNRGRTYSRRNRVSWRAFVRPWNGTTQSTDFSFTMIVHAYETEERGFGEGAAPCKSKLTWKWRLCRDEK